ncbi:MAG: CvpA family protein [Eubacteriales bacterium]|nr:CvpA family protein [Eubacteriales bacterium]
MFFSFFGPFGNGGDNGNPFQSDPFGQGPGQQQNPFSGMNRQQGSAKDMFRNFFNGKPTYGKTKPSRVILTAVIFLVQLFVQFYIMLPAINIQNMDFWLFVGENLIILLALTALLCTGSLAKNIRKVVLAVIGIGVVAAVALSLLSSPILQSHRYADIISADIEQKEIAEYTPTIDNVPLLDKDSAARLANRALGNLVDEVSQFELYNTYQATVDGAPVRVQPLDYVGFVKWFLNRNTGIPAYITVDMKTQNTQIVRMPEGEGIKYSQNAYFNDNLTRHVRFRYPCDMLGTPHFELDENGNPYWVYPVLEHKIMLFNGTDVKGVITVDPVTGDCQRYMLGEIPDWIDNVYSPELIMQQYDWYGSYQSGWLNSVIGQKGVVQATEGYNYIPKGNDLYMYTGVTSVVSDESNIGFIFTNLRTRETEFYEIAGAEEFSAMESAEGVVQHLNYDATFPILLMIEGQPTYTVALKDNAGLVKQYGMVNMAQYQLVATGATITDCLENYRALLERNGAQVSESATTELSGVIDDIRTAVINGTTYYYIRLQGNEVYYILSAAENEQAVLLNVGDTAELNVETADEGNELQKAGLKGATAAVAAQEEQTQTESEIIDTEIPETQE